MTLEQYKLSDFIEIEETAEQPHLWFTQLHGYPDTSNWYFLTGPARVEDGVLVLENDSPQATTRRPEEHEVLEFVAALADRDAWDQTPEWRWEVAGDEATGDLADDEVADEE